MDCQSIKYLGAFTNQPPELTGMVLSFLPVREIVANSQVCKHFHQLIQQSWFWRSVGAHHFPHVSGLKNRRAVLSLQALSHGTWRPRNLIKLPKHDSSDIAMIAHQLTVALIQDGKLYYLWPTTAHTKIRRMGLDTGYASVCCAPDLQSFFTCRTTPSKRVRDFERGTLRVGERAPKLSSATQDGVVGLVSKGAARASVLQPEELQRQLSQPGTRQCSRCSEGKSLQIIKFFASGRSGAMVHHCTCGYALSLFLGPGRGWTSVMSLLPSRPHISTAFCGNQEVLVVAVGFRLHTFTSEGILVGSLRLRRSLRNCVPQLFWQHGRPCLTFLNQENLQIFSPGLAP